MRKALLCVGKSALSVVTGKGTRMVSALFFAFLVSLFIGISIYARDAKAVTSSTINFQARVLTASGAVIPDGTVSVQFKIYNAATAGTNEWTETQSVSSKNGYITASLGSVTPFASTIDWSQEHWLTMNVNGDGEMGPNRMKMTAVPYSFRSGQADSLTNGATTLTAANLAQLSPGTIQGVNSANAAIRINQTGAGDLMQLQSVGADVFKVTNTGTVTAAGNLTVQGGTATVGTATQSGSLVLQNGSGGSTTLTASAIGLQITTSGNITIGSLDTTGNLLVLDGKTTTGDPAGTNGAMYYNALLGKFRCYENGVWKDCINGQNTNSTASFVSGLQNVAANATGAAVESLIFTSATAVSNTAGVTGFTAPAAGSFRTCLVKNNAAITAGTLNLRWRVNGASVGSGTCTMTNSATNNRQSAEVLDPGVVTFNAGDTIGIAFDTVGLTPGGTNDFTVYWTVEYYSSAVGGGGSGTQTLQDTYNNSGPATITLDGIRGPLTVLDNASALGTNLFQVQDNSGSNTYLAVSASGVSTTALTVTSGGANITGNSIISGTLSGLTGLTILSGGANITGGIDNNSGGITNVGDISGVGSSLVANGALTIQTGTGSNLTLDSNGGSLIFTSSTLERTAGGATSILLNDTADTTLVISNNDGTAVANLSVEGSVTAQSLVGNGSALTNLDASNLATGSVSDSLLSTNVALLNTDQTFTGLPTFSKGIILDNTATAIAGLLRFTGTDFEGYNGSGWVSLTGGGGGSGPLTIAAIQAYDNTGGTDLNTSTPTAMPWDSETKKDTGFTHSTVTNNTRVYLDAAGWYKISYNVSGLNQTANRNTVFCQIRMNGTTYNAPSGSYSYARNTTDAGGTNSSTVYIQTTGANEYYEVMCSQSGSAGGDLAVAGQSWTIAELTTAPSGGATNAFVQGGNAFGATAILGTGDAHDLRLVANGSAILQLSASTGDATFNNNLLVSGGLSVTGDTNLDGNTIIGNASSDTLTINADTVNIPNGLVFDSGTLAIDASNNRVGINTASPGNTLGVNTANTADASAQVLIFTDGISNKGEVIQTANGQLANAFEIQDYTGQALLAIGGGGQLVLGNDQSTPQAGLITFNDSVGSNGFTSVLGTNTLTASRTINLPDENGTICLSNSTNCGFLQFSPSSAQTDGSTTQPSIFINKTGATANIMTLQKGGVPVFSVLNSGALAIQTTDTSAISINNSGGTQFFNVDTTGTGIVKIGGSAVDGTATFLVLDSYNGGSADPTGGQNGAQYYNTTLNKLRCYQNNAWKDCISEPTFRSFVSSTSVAVADNNTTNYWRTAAENNNSYPNITPSQSSGKAIMGIVTIETTATSNTDVEVTARIERGIGSVPTCNAGTQVGAQPGTFSSNIGGLKASTVQFVDVPNTTSPVYYVVCADTATVGTGANMTRIRVTLQEVNNSN